MLLDIRKAIDELLENDVEVVEIRLSPTGMKQVTEELTKITGKKEDACISSIFGIPVTVDKVLPENRAYLLKPRR